MQESRGLDQMNVEQAVKRIDEYLRVADKHGDDWLFETSTYGDEAFDAEVTKRNLRSAWQCVLAVLEATGHRFLFEEAREDYAAWQKEPMASEMGPEEPYMVWPGRVRRYLSYLESFYMAPRAVRVTPAAELIDVLKRTEKYVVHPKLFSYPPCAEADLHHRIEELLSCYYADLLPKPAQPKPIRGFVPDTGIPSQGTLIEYKYLDAPEQSGAVIEQIFADLAGYQSHAYPNIVFVIYETGRFWRRDQWQAAIDQAKPRQHVNTVLLRGYPATEEQKERRSLYLSSIATRASAKHATAVTAKATDKKPDYLQENE